MEDIDVLRIISFSIVYTSLSYVTLSDLDAENVNKFSVFWCYESINSIVLMFLEKSWLIRRLLKPMDHEFLVYLQLSLYFPCITLFSMLMLIFKVFFEYLSYHFANILNDLNKVEYQFLHLMHRMMKNYCKVEFLR
jgi:hypothetical protein